MPLMPSGSNANLFQPSFLLSLTYLRILHIGLKNQPPFHQFGLGNQIYLPPQVQGYSAMGVSVVMKKDEKFKILSVHYVPSPKLFNSYNKYKR